MNGAAWEVALDALAAQVAEQWQAVADGEHERIVCFRPPPDLGPLPVALEARASELLHEVRMLEELLRTRLSAMARESAVVHRFTATTSVQPPAALVDGVA